MPGDVTFHYTAATTLLRIIASAEIRPTSERISPRERPAVWFSSHPVWEPTATKFVKELGRPRPMTKTEMAARFGLGRIVVPVTVAPVTWEAFVRQSGIRKADAVRLARVAERQGARPSDWRVSFEPVPYASWLGVEIWDEAGWHPFTPADLPRLPR